MSPQPEPWLDGPVPGIPPVLQPAAHALLQVRQDVRAHASEISAGDLWKSRGAASAGFHLLHLAGSLERLFTYARGESLNDEQKAAVRTEAAPHPEIGVDALVAIVDRAVERALDQLRSTDPASVFAERRVGRAGLPSTVIGCLFHGAEHSTRHVGQFITTVKLMNAGGTEV